MNDKTNDQLEADAAERKAAEDKAAADHKEAEAKAEKAEADRKEAEAKAEPPLNTVAPVVTIDPANPDSVKAQHEAVDEKMAQLNEHNAAGAAKLAEAEEAAVEASKSVPHVPTGKEWNKNTPVIDEFGNKHW